MLETMFSGLFIVATGVLILACVVVFVWDRKYITRNCSRCGRANFIPKRDPFFECKHCGEDLDKLAKQRKQEREAMQIEKSPSPS